MNFLKNHIEALIFCATSPLRAEDIQACLSEVLGAAVPLADVQLALQALVSKYDADTYPFQICAIADGYQFLTKPAYQSSVEVLLKQRSKKRLSSAALETIAIIAYKQPITKTEIEQIRGVNCDYALQKLLEKELIAIKGKSDSVGRPLLYGTSAKFMDYFGLRGVKDLPQLKDVTTTDNQIGTVNE